MKYRSRERDLRTSDVGEHGFVNDVEYYSRLRARRAG